jgi:hypothetical protein
MTDSTPNNSRISVSEDRLRLLFAEFKLDLLQQLSQYATTAAVEKQSERIRALEDTITGNVAVSKWQKVFIGSAVAIFIPLITTLIVVASQGGIH